MVIFDNSAAASQTNRSIDEIRAQLRHKTEFKFSKSSDSLRDAFFQRVGQCPFTVRALIVRKDAPHNEFLQRSTDGFYNHCAKLLMANDAGTLHAASVRIDGRGSREFQRTLGSYFRRELGARVRDIKMCDSARDPLMQLADMCIGAITRAERDREDADRWKRMLTPRIGHIAYLG
jgi:hypothetical protein